MADDTPQNPEDEFRDMLREFLSGNSGFDPEKLAGAAGLPNDPAVLRQLMAQLQSALQSSGDGINWTAATDQATTLARQSAIPTGDVQRRELEQALTVAALWLDEVTYVSDLPLPPKLMSRAEWVRALAATAAASRVVSWRSLSTGRPSMSTCTTSEERAA